MVCGKQQHIFLIDGFQAYFVKDSILSFRCKTGSHRNDGYLTATPDVDVEPDRAYYYEMLVPEDCGGVFELPVADRGALGQTENSTLYIDGIINDNVALIADFDYAKALTAFGVLLYYAMILAAATIVYIAAAVVLYLYDIYLTQYQQTIIRSARIAASAAVGGAALFLLVFSGLRTECFLPLQSRSGRRGFCLRFGCVTGIRCRSVGQGLPQEESFP